MVYLRVGVYQRKEPFILTEEDSGSTWKIYPSDPVNSAILDGSGLDDILLILGGSHITVEGLTIRNYSSRGIGVHGGKGWKNAKPHFHEDYPTAAHNVIRNNIVENGNVPSPGWDRAAINTQGTTPNSHILHNVVRNTTGYGIGVWALQEGDDISGTLVSGNAVLNTCTRAKDGAAIYICDRTAASKAIMVENNFVRDYGDYEHELRAVYLDDWASNTTVCGNILTGKGTQPVLIHGGSNNVVTGNIIDVGNSGKPCVLNYAAHRNRPMLNNWFTGNVILSSYPEDRSGGAYRKFGDITNPEVKNNLYYNYSTGVVNTGGQYYLIKDTHPLTANPQIAGWDYQVADSSAIYKQPTAFQPLKRKWGPPGYLLPEAGTAPSCLLLGDNALYLHAESCDTLSGVSKNGIAAIVADAENVDQFSNIHLGNGFDAFPAMAVSACDDGDWVGFRQVAIHHPGKTFTVRLASASGANGTITLRIDEPNGKVAATLKIKPTGSYTEYEEQAATVDLKPGIYDLYMVFQGGKAIGNFDYFKIH